MVKYQLHDCTDSVNSFFVYVLLSNTLGHTAEVIAVMLQQSSILKNTIILVSMRFQQSALTGGEKERKRPLGCCTIKAAPS